MCFLPTALAIQQNSCFNQNISCSLVIVCCIDIQSGTYDHILRSSIFLSMESMTAHIPISAPVVLGITSRTTSLKKLVSTAFVVVVHVYNVTVQGCRYDL